MFNETPVVSSTRWALSCLIGICTAEQEQQHAETRQPVGTRLHTTPDSGSTAAWKGPSVKEGRIHWVCAPNCKGLPSVRPSLYPSAPPKPALKCTGDRPCLTGRSVWYVKSSTSTAVQLHLTWGVQQAKNVDNLVTMGRWRVPPCDGGSLGEGRRGDVARQV